jgi:xanthine dehydrogenase YagT iron-sulfur-binding subunit
MADGRHTRRRDRLKSTGIVAAAARTAADPAAVAHAGARVLTSTIRINDTVHAVSHEARVSLLDLLRERLDLTGTKKGCNEGACGACTVLVDGRRVNACMILAASCDGHEVQQALIDQDAFQCGYCTPGQIVSAVACIEEGHVRSEAEIAEWMSGNICRCAAYPQVVAAVQQAASRRARKG